MFYNIVERKGWLEVETVQSLKNLKFCKAFNILEH